MAISERLRSRYTVNGPYTRSTTDKLYMTVYDKWDEHSPQRKWVALGTSKRRVAEDEIEYLRIQLYSGEWDPWESAEPAGDLRLEEAIEQYLEHYEAQGFADTTERHTRSTLELMADEIGSHRAVQAITTDDIRQWLATTRARSGGGAPSPYTIRSYLSRVSGFFEWAQDRGHIDEVPTDSISRPSVSGDTFHVLQPSEINRMIRTAAAQTEMDTDHQRRWMCAALNLWPCAGLRSGELCRLRWADVERLDAASDMATLRIRPHDASETDRLSGWQPKTTGSVRAVQLFRRGTLTLRWWRARYRAAYGEDPPPHRTIIRTSRDTPASPKRLRELVRIIATDAGVRTDDRPIRGHDIRHTWISWLVNEFEHEIGVSTVADMAGHADVSMTQQYRGPSEASQRSALLRAMGEDQSEGEVRHTYEAVRDWLQGIPEGLPDVEGKPCGSRVEGG